MNDAVGIPIVEICNDLLSMVGLSVLSGNMPSSYAAKETVHCGGHDSNLICVLMYFCSLSLKAVAKLMAQYAECGSVFYAQCMTQVQGF